MSTELQRSDRQSVALVVVCAVLVLANLFGVLMIVNSLVSLARSQTQFVDATADRLEAMSRRLNEEETVLE